VADGIDQVTAIGQTSEGVIRFGASVGLDCFRENKIAARSVREGLPFGHRFCVQAAPEGGVRIA
jgi:hypothetical protein